MDEPPRTNDEDGPGLGARLRTLIGGRPTEPEPEMLEPPDEEVLVDVVLYAEDSLAGGTIAIAGDRLTDLLNEGRDVELTAVQVQDLRDGAIHDIGPLAVPVDELLMVEAGGPRGHQQRRRQTRRQRVAIQTGPFLVEGTYHGLPGADPVAGFRRREAMVPLTDVTIEFHLAGVVERRRADLVIVNRTLIDWIVESGPPDASPIPDIAFTADGDLPAKDMTDDRRD